MCANFVTLIGMCGVFIPLFRPSLCAFSSVFLRFFSVFFCLFPHFPVFPRAFRDSRHGVSSLLFPFLRQIGKIFSGGTHMENKQGGSA